MAQRNSIWDESLTHSDRSSLKSSSVDVIEKRSRTFSPQKNRWTGNGRRKEGEEEADFLRKKEEDKGWMYDAMLCQE